MPKRIKNLWDDFVSWPNLMIAAIEATRNKREYEEIIRFNHDKTENLLQIQKDLKNGTWEVSSFHEFLVFEPKKSKIQAPAFRDRVVHHALIQVIGKAIEDKFIDHSYACRTGKGTHAASMCLYDFLYRAKKSMGKTYVLQADISKYFESIDHNILWKLIQNIIGDKRILNIIWKIIESRPDKGLPLGALTSQVFANLYLTELDKFIKEELGVKYYIRYMDDFIIIDNDKKKLKVLLEKIKWFVENKLNLELNKKTSIYPASNGVNFAGYWHWHDRIRPRKENIKKAKKTFRQASRKYKNKEVGLDYVIYRVASFAGYIKHCDGFYTGRSVFEELTGINVSDLPKVARPYKYKERYLEKYFRDKDKKEKIKRDRLNMKCPNYGTDEIPF